jgi:hypothetical protein
VVLIREFLVLVRISIAAGGERRGCGEEKIVIERSSDLRRETQQMTNKDDVDSMIRGIPRRKD